MRIIGQYEAQESALHRSSTRGNSLPLSSVPDSTQRGWRNSWRNFRRRATPMRSDGWKRALNLKSLLSQVEQSTGRIAELVKAVKSYSYMDQSPMQEVDIHEGIESTLTMLGHKLKNVTVVRAFDRSVPRIMAYGSELNQVWTNLKWLTATYQQYCPGRKQPVCRITRTPSGHRWLARARECNPVLHRKTNRVTAPDRRPD